jgi:hypothetical protein
LLTIDPTLDVPLLKNAPESLLSDGDITEITNQLVSIEPSLLSALLHVSRSFKRERFGDVMFDDVSTLVSQLYCFEPQPFDADAVPIAGGQDPATMNELGRQHHSLYTVPLHKALLLQQNLLKALKWHSWLMGVLDSDTSTWTPTQSTALHLTIHRARSDITDLRDGFLTARKFFVEGSVSFNIMQGREEEVISLEKRKKEVKRRMDVIGKVMKGGIATREEVLALQEELVQLNQEMSEVQKKLKALSKAMGKGGKGKQKEKGDDAKGRVRFDEWGTEDQEKAIGEC